MCHTGYMNTILSKIKRLARQIRGLFPSQLPQGVSELESFVDHLISTYALPTQDRDSIKFVVANAIMHLGPTAAYKAKIYFVLILKAAGAKQVAAAGFQEVKMKQQAAQEAAKKEATLNPVASNGSTQ